MGKAKVIAKTARVSYTYVFALIKKIQMNHDNFRYEEKERTKNTLKGCFVFMRKKWLLVWTKNKGIGKDTVRSGVACHFCVALLLFVKMDTPKSRGVKFE